jgi:hypothetical protein
MEGGYWAKLTRPPERGQPRTVEHGTTAFPRPAEQVLSYVFLLQFGNENYYTTAYDIASQNQLV